MRESSALVGEMLTREMGKPYQEAVSEIGYGSTATDYYAEVARHDAGRVFGPIAEGQINFTTKDPLGVVVWALPFNFPIVLLVLANGCRDRLRERRHHKAIGDNHLNHSSIRRCICEPSSRPDPGSRRRRGRRKGAR